MNINITEASIPQDAPALALIDQQMFNARDAAPPEFFCAEQRRMRSFWVLGDGGDRIGTIVLMHNAGFCETYTGGVPFEVGTLLIASTGLLPEFRRMGIGTKLKAWQMAYAREYGFRRVIAHVRASNIASIALNMKFGFQVAGAKKAFYLDGEDCVRLERRMRT